MFFFKFLIYFIKILLNFHPNHFKIVLTFSTICFAVSPQKSKTSLEGPLLGFFSTAIL